MAISARESLVAVVDLDGRPLSPCSKSRAEENVTEGLAIWETSVLRLQYRPLAYRRIYRQVYRRDGYVCAWCGGSGSTLDHLIPVCWGGQAMLDNCVVACRACNHSRNNALPSVFVARTGFQPSHPVILALLAVEAPAVESAFLALKRRTVKTCRSKEEAAVWAAHKNGYPERINREPPPNPSTRVRPMPPLGEIYIP